MGYGSVMTLGPASRSLLVLRGRHVAAGAVSSGRLMHWRRNRQVERKPAQRLPTISCSASAPTAANEDAAYGNGTGTMAAELMPSPMRGGRQPMDNKYIMGLVMQHKGHLLLAGCALIFATASNLASPVIVGTIVESLAGQQPLSVYKKYLGILAALYLTEPLLSKLYVFHLCQVAEKVSSDLRQELFRCLLMQKIEFYDRYNPAQLTNLLSMELESIRRFVFNNSSRDRGIRALLESTGAVVVLFFLSWRLGPLLAAVILSAGVGAALYRRATKPLENRATEARIGMSAVASQAFSSITTVRSFAGEALERERFRVHCKDAYTTGSGFAKAKSNLEAVNRMAIHVSLLVLYSLGGWLIANGYMTLKTLMAGIGFTFSLIFASQGVVNTIAEFRGVQASIYRVRDILEKSQPCPAMIKALPPGAWWDSTNVWSSREKPELGQHDAVTAAESGALELKNVSFRYPLRPDMPVLKDCSITLEPGTVTAVVGRSGSGKSTIAAILSKFYTPDKGEVLVGGQDASQFSAAAWSNAVALVGQEPVLFEGTVMDNIGYGRRKDFTREEIQAAAELANAHEFIEELPDGYDTNVGMGGKMLSGGQRQRIAIARAFFKDSPVILLDEATSALDSLSEKLVQQAIDRLVKGKTVMVIAHRLSTVQNADKICVVEGGTVVEQGTHEELVEEMGIYATLVDSQSMILNSTLINQSMGG